MITSYVVVSSLSRLRALMSDHRHAQSLAQQQHELENQVRGGSLELQRVNHLASEKSNFSGICFLFFRK